MPGSARSGRSYDREALTDIVSQEASSNFALHIRANPPVTHSTTLLTPNLLIQRYGEIILPSKLKRNKGKGVDLSLRDARILLKYLQRDKRLLVGDAAGEVCLVSHICSHFAAEMTSDRSIRS